MNLKIALAGYLVPNLTFFAIFIFFGVFDTSVAQKYRKHTKTRFFHFFGSEIEKIGFSHPLTISYIKRRCKVQKMGKSRETLDFAPKKAVNAIFRSISDFSYL